MEVIDQLILFHKPNNKPQSEMIIDHTIPPTKHLNKAWFDPVGSISGNGRKTSRVYLIEVINKLSAAVSCCTTLIKGSL
jgi:hypothetical protein